MIMNPKNMSKLDFTTENFSGCFELLLKEIMQVVLAPLEAASILISASVSILSGVMNSFAEALANLRGLLLDNTGGTAEKQTELVSIITKFSIKIKSALAKGQGILITVLYIFFSIYQIISSSFYVLLVGSSIILGVMFVVLIFVWSVYIYFFLIPFVGSLIASAYLWVPVGLTLIYVSFMIMVLVVVVFTANVIRKTN